ncbi:keratin-associated protein 5-4-like [Penaeus monodon]|uniref:keratin-associated protein 5-4-like n=1 Tax=Penaeus monodon TaxID=6687 RepID=UPI0018A7209A|nr:keratin-associated protein 5-4-like [Penaeus monodon]
MNDAFGGRCNIWDRSCDFRNPCLCTGLRCSCCINCTNQINTSCRDRYAGSCKKSCDETELEIDDCKAGCKCCGCKISQMCLDAGGHCIVGRKGCNGRVTRCCEGKNCYCCIPKTCRQRKCCTFPGGRCAKACKKGEIAEKGLCSKDCVCCFDDRCPDSPKCQALDGRCVESCEADEVSVPWLCGGETCTCCVKNNCNQTKCCGAFGGSCEKFCSEGEKPVADLCQGKCQCCVAVLIATEDKWFLLEIHEKIKTIFS